MQLTTARFLLGSVPSQLFLSFASAVGAVASSAFRVFASLTYAVRSCSPSAPSLRLLLRSVAFGFTRYRLFASLRRSGFLWLRFRKRPRVRHTPPAPTTVGESVRLCIISTAHPHVFRYEKGGRLPVPLMGVNSYSSKPCTTVSSVLESNAFAASVTGRYANRTDWVCPSSP